MKNIYRTLLVAAAGLLVLAGCQKEDQHLAKAILTSANLLEFEAQNPVEQMITVYADADWTVEKPEWVTVEPGQGTGTMDVTISVAPNMEGNVMDNPRKCELIFKGANLASQAIVEIHQKGDKFKGVKEVTVSEAIAAADETMVIIPESQVMAVAADGFIVSDGKDNLFIGTDNKVKAGDKVKIMGMKVKLGGLAAIQTPDEVTVTGNAALSYPEPKEISAEIDQFKADSRVYISVEGEFDGSVIKVEGQKFGVHPLNPDPAFNLASLKGSILKLSGYFAGRAEPVINMTVAKVEKKGSAVILPAEFPVEWLIGVGEANIDKINFAKTFPEEGYIAASKGKGKISYVTPENMEDPNGKFSRVVGKYGDPYVTGAWPGDFWEFEVDGNVKAGTQLKISFKAATSGTGHKFWRLEYYDGKDWVVPADLKQETEVTGSKIIYTHVMEPSSSSRIPVEAVVTYVHDTEAVLFRLVCAANWQSNGKGALGNRNGGTMRLTVEDENDMASIPMIVKLK